MRKSLTDIVVIFCVLMLVFIIAVDQTSANSSLSSYEPSLTVAYFSDVVSQVVRTFSVFYYALLASSTDASDQVGSTVSSVSTESESEEDEIIKKVLEDGFVLSVDERKAHINLGIEDGVRRGMLLEIYRPKGLYDAMSNMRYPIGGSLGYGLVVEVHEFTSVMYLSHFEIKTVDSGNDGKGIKVAIEVHDRVRRPPLLEEEIVELLAEQVVTENAKILSIDGNMFSMTAFDPVFVGSTITLIKIPKEIIHPVTGELVVLGEEKRADAIVADVKGRTILLSVDPNTSGHFIASDIVKITKR
ncbi:hypothetical protein CMK22_07605 [Candidatus Poribacteria bacterium]|nr:hypothetical protein [Candidatus Poribacteria bacterium]